MALPNINGNSFGKSQNFVGEALNAFLSTSQEFRALTEAAGRSRERDQNTFLKSRADNRANINQEDNLINSQVNREVTLGEFAVRMEEAKYKKEVLRPMLEESRRLDFEEKKDSLASKREERIAKELRRQQNQQELQAFDSFASSEDTMFEPVKELAGNTIYWDSKKNRPLIGAVGEGGDLELLDRDGNKVRADLSSLSKSRSFDPSLMVDRKKLLDEAEKTGSPQFEKIRNLNEAVDNRIQAEQKKLTPDKDMLRSLSVRKQEVESRPEYQQMAFNGTLDSEAARERKQRVAEEQVGSILRLSLGSDAEARSFMQENPGVVQTLGGLDARSQMSAIKNIIDRREKGGLSASASEVQKLQADLRLQQIIQRKAKEGGDSIGDNVSEKARDKELELKAKLEAMGVGESADTGVGSNVSLPAGVGSNVKTPDYLKFLNDRK